MKSFSVKEIADQAGVSEETVRRWIRSGKLEASQPSRKEGNSVTEEALRQFAAFYPKNSTWLNRLIRDASVKGPAPLGAAAIVAGTASLVLNIYYSLKDTVEQEVSLEKLAKVIRRATQESDKLRSSIQKKRAQMNDLAKEIEEEQRQIDLYDELIKSANSKMLSALSKNEEDH